MKRDQFGRDLRKAVEGFIDSDRIRELYYQYLEDQETMEETVRQFAIRVSQVYGLEIKGRKGIKQFSNKRQKTETEYKKSLKEEVEGIHGRICCTGCGTCQGYIDPSHFIPRSVRPDLIADPENRGWHCRERCHALCESGHYRDLNDGAKIIEYMKRVDPKYLMEKLKNKTG